jgi:hypothetical protein
MTNKQLSPAAQEVLTAAICDGPELEYRIAAALRAAADQVVRTGEEHWLAEWTIRRQLLAIANELEAQ